MIKYCPLLKNNKLLIMFFVLKFELNFVVIIN